MQNLRKRRHVLVQVRKACGLTQEQLAKLLKVSTITIQRIEQGTLALSEELARKIQDQFDVSAEWLLANSSKIPPLSSRNAYWTKDLYEFAQGKRFVATETKLSSKPGAIQVNLEYTPEELADKLSDWHIANYTAYIAAYIKGAQGGPRQGILLHRLNEFLDSLRKDFEVDLGTMQAHAVHMEATQTAFKQAAKEYSEREIKRLWRKGPKPALKQASPQS